MHQEGWEVLWHCVCICLHADGLDSSHKTSNDEAICIKKHERCCDIVLSVCLYVHGLFIPHKKICAWRSMRGVVTLFCLWMLMGSLHPSNCQTLPKMFASIILIDHSQLQVLESRSIMQTEYSDEVAEDTNRWHSYANLFSHTKQHSIGSMFMYSAFLSGFMIFTNEFLKCLPSKRCLIVIVDFNKSFQHLLLMNCYSLCLLVDRSLVRDIVNEHQHVGDWYLMQTRHF